MSDAWSPQQYERFARERRQPFDDLLRLVHAIPGGHAMDLGCGSGELTVELHEHIGAARTIGIDSSRAMLDGAPAAPGVEFEVGDITDLGDRSSFDLIVASASLQWVPGHEHVLADLTARLAPRGQLAVQVPSNHDHASHTTITAVASEEPFASALGGGPLPDPVAANVLAPERYAEVLHALGFVEQHVRLQVYAHELTSATEVVEWTKGTSLTRYKRALPADMYEDFVERYRAQLVADLGDRRPYLYAFKRILFWARRP